jgi:hypothetical protein
MRNYKTAYLLIIGEPKKGKVIEPNRTTCSCLKFCTELDIKHANTLAVRGCILRKNPTDALLYVNTTVFTLFQLLYVSALKGPTSGSTDSFCDEQGQQNT